MLLQIFFFFNALIPMNCADSIIRNAIILYFVLFYNINLYLHVQCTSLTCHHSDHCAQEDKIMIDRARDVFIHIMENFCDTTATIMVFPKKSAICVIMNIVYKIIRNFRSELRWKE